MRFMMLVQLAGEDQDYGDVPEDAAVQMGKFNEELSKAGVLLALDGLQPTSKGARVSYAGGQPSVTDGPFTEAKEVVGGYWIIQAKSKEEAVEWARRAPMGESDTVEVRQIFELEDHSEEVQAATDNIPTPPEQTIDR